MHLVAQTNLQLYNQMLDQQRPAEELMLVRQAYDLLALLSAGYYQADGKPFLCHGVGVASILCQIRSPAKFIAFGLLHNAYMNGDFGTGLRTPITPRKRALVRDRVGTEVEELMIRFRDFRVRPKTIDRIEAELPKLSETDRMLVITDLADHMEKYVDRGVLYFGDGSWITDEVDALEPRLIALAQSLGQPELAAMMSEAFAAVDKQEPMADFLRLAPDRRYVALTLPMSARPKLFSGIQAYVERGLHRWRRGSANRAAKRSISAKAGTSV